MKINMEKIFPFLGVRVVAVNDNFDSMRKTFKNNMLMNSLTNIVNEYYARDISRKVTQARRKSGLLRRNMRSRKMN